MPPRRAFPPLALTMPHPELPTRTRSPCTPRACTPSTPVMSPKHMMTSPRTSMESWSSSGHPEEDIIYEWTVEQISFLSRTLDALPDHLYTPFNGAVPPSNLLDKIARSVLKAQGSEWPHSMRQTRIKLLNIAREKNKENMTIDEADEDADNTDAVEPAGAEEESMKPKRRALYRQSSMDFLPAKGKDMSNVCKLSSRLQHADGFIAPYRPYTRSSPSRSVPSSQPTSNDSYPAPPTTSTRSRHEALSARLRYGTLSHGHPQMLRRTVSTVSNSMSDVSMATNSSASASGSGKMAKSTLPRRSDSFSVSGADPNIKRAPSYPGVMDVDSPVEKRNNGKGKEAETRTRTRSSSKQQAEGEPQEVASPKKRTRSRSATASPVSNSPERKKSKKATSDEKEKDMPASPKSPSRSKTSPTSLSSSSPRSTSTRTNTRTNLHSSTATKPTVSSAAKQQSAVATRTPASPRTRTTSGSSASTASPASPSKDSTSTRTPNATSTRTRSDIMFGPPLPVPQSPTVLPTFDSSRI